MRDLFKKPSGLLLFIDALPLLVPIFFALFGIGITALLIVGQFKSAYIYPFAALVITGVLGVYFRFRPNLSPSRERLVCNLLVLIGISIWGIGNMTLASQHIYSDRDSAVYAVAAEWLTNHQSLNISIPEVFDGVNNLSAASVGFSVDKTPEPHVYAQGQHLLPALLAVGGRVVGQTGMLKLNVVIGALALLSFYGYARLLGRPRWAVLATACIAASMPFIYFSRETFTEPLAVMFVFGGLALLWDATKLRKSALYFLAGLVFGAGALTRIDAYMIFSGLLIALAFWLISSPKKTRTERKKHTLLVLLGISIASVVGWLDVSLLAQPYFYDLRGQFYREIALLLGVLMAGTMAVYIVWYRPIPLLQKLNDDTRTWRAGIAPIVVLVFVVILLCRPFIVWFLSGFQHITIVPHAHNYAEISAYWVSWYLGPALALLGTLGLTLTASKLFDKKHALLLPGFVVVGVTSVIYLIQPSITPDQIWASRRLVPVILTGLAAFSVISLDWLTSKYFVKIQYGKMYAVLLSICILVGVLFTSSPIVLTRTVEQLGTIQQSCKTLPKTSAVVLVGLAGEILVQPLHVYCNIPTAAYVPAISRPTSNQLADISKSITKLGYIPIVGYFSDDVLRTNSDDVNSETTSIDASYKYLEHTYLNAPQHILDWDNTLNFGRIQPDGSIVPIK